MIGNVINVSCKALTKCSNFLCAEQLDLFLKGAEQALLDDNETVEDPDPVVESSEPNVVIGEFDSLNPAITADDKLGKLDKGYCDAYYLGAYE